MIDDLSAFKGIVKATLLSAVFWIGLILSARAQEVKAVINDQDLAALNQIISEQVPSRWASPVANWINNLIARQDKINADKADAAKLDAEKKAKAEADRKAAEAAKVDPKKDEPAPKQ